MFTDDSNLFFCVIAEAVQGHDDALSHVLHVGNVLVEILQSLANMLATAVLRVAHLHATVHLQPHDCGH